MKIEFDALDKTSTWKLADLSSNVKPIRCIWIYKINRKSDGIIERFKAQLVSKRYNQIKRLDYSDTFSPIVKLTTIILLVLTFIHNWDLQQHDVNNAFLHSELHEGVYIIVPPGFQTSKPNKVCKLIKSLYELKHAIRKWFEKLASFLIHHGYTQAT